MNEKEQISLANMRDCWIGGGSALAFAPESWKAVASSPTPEENERRLLALAGQAFDVAFRPAFPKGLEERADLPQLSLPIIPEALRPLFRVALKQAQTNGHIAKVIALIEKRGFVAHPLDWMPAASDDSAPAVYAPWVDWISLATKETKENPDELTVDNWDEFYPAARKNILRDMRRSNPDIARELLVAKAASEPAEKRLPLIELLKFNLSEKDIPYLTNLLSDRSGKVQKMVARFLAQLGERGKQTAEANTELEELADFIVKEKKGLIARRIVFTPKKLKNYAQESRRRQLLDSFLLIDLATKLDAAEADLVDGWQFGVSSDVDGDFVQMVNGSGNDDIVLRLADRLIADREVTLITHLLPRLDNAHRSQVMRIILSGSSQHIWRLSELDMPDMASREDIIKSSLYRELYKSLKENDSSKQNYTLASLNAIAFLATPDTAKAVLDDLSTLGILSVDPSLALLRLNVELAAISKIRKTNNA